MAIVFVFMRDDWGVVPGWWVGGAAGTGLGGWGGGAPDPHRSSCIHAPSIVLTDARIIFFFYRGAEEGNVRIVI